MGNGLKIDKKKPISLYRDHHDLSAQTNNAALGASVDHLYQELQNAALKANPQNINLDPAISQDYILSKLVHEYQQTRNQFDELVTQAKQKMAACRKHSGYLPDLNQLLTKSESSLSTLIKRLDKLHCLINERAQLIAPKKIDETTLLNARTELMTALDYFMLNFCLINIQNKKDPNTPFFIDQLSSITNLVISGLHNKNLRFNKTSVNTLDLHLRTHLGLQTTFERFFGNTDSIPITENQANQLIKDIFKNCPIPTSEQEVKNELASIFDLVAKIQDLPIVTIRNFETLMDCEKKQHESVTRLNSDLLKTLQHTRITLESKLSLFAGSQYAEFAKVVKAQQLLEEAQSKEVTVTQIMDDYTKRRAILESSSSPLQRLTDITSLQQDMIAKFSSLDKQSKEHDITAQARALTLEKLYTIERSSMSNKLSEALNHAQFALTELPLGDKGALMKASETLKLLNQTETKTTLGSLESKFITTIDDLKRCVQEVKEALKMSWAKKLLESLPAKEVSNLNTYLTPQQITSIIDNALIVYSLPQLNTLNPFINPLQEQTLRINERTPMVLSYYSSISTKPGSELSNWNNSMTEQLGSIKELIDQRIVLENTAELIEKRFHTKAYKTSIHVIKTLNDEFLRLFKTHVNTTNSDLHFLKEPPEFYLNQSNMSHETTVALNQIDSRLVKLVQIRANFEELNSKYINQNPELCNDELYINQLFKITKSHLQNNSMEDFSKNDVDKRSSFVYWFRIHVLRPIAQCIEYINPYVRYLSHSDRSKQSYTPRFFLPTCKTPLASKTESNLVTTGKKTLKFLESEYPTTLIAAAF